MTTKRKQIMKAIAANSSAVLDDLVMATGLERKNLHDNIKAALKEFLIERIRDDVTGLPAYKLTGKGRMWLDRQNDSVTTQAMRGDISMAVADDATSLASDLPGQAATVIEPPKRDESPVAVRSDESALSKSVTEFCEWVGKRCQLRTPRTLREAKDVIEALEQAGNDLGKRIEERDRTEKTLRDLIASKDDEITELQRRGHRYEHNECYVVMPDYPDMTIHSSLDTARAEAEAEAMENSPVHLVAIIDTAEMQISWKNAA
jgi:DNA-binding MarR family transcriptional regulator